VGFEPKFRKETNLRTNKVVDEDQRPGMNLLC